MKPAEIAKARLMSQHIAGTTFTHAKDIVGWMGAMQAQDPQMAKWALGVRIPASTESDVDAALNRGDILRTHLLRPTWHLVSSADIHWMIDLSAPHIRASMKSRHKELELTPGIVSKSNKVIVKALEKDKTLSREKLVAELEKEGIATGGNRASHLFCLAELDKIICSGEIQDQKMTYALFAERVPPAKPLSRDEALATLAARYFESHGPATLADFTWWSGLSATNAKKALEMVKQDFIAQNTGPDTYWLSPRLSWTGINEQAVHLLPAFDEFIISYKDRSAAINPAYNPKAVSNNGIFWPTVTVMGQVKGIWKRTLKKDKVLVEMEFFAPPAKKMHRPMEKALRALGHFLQRKAETVTPTAG